MISLKDLSGKLARWPLMFQAFDFEIVHPKGSDNGASRYGLTSCRNEEMKKWGRMTIGCCDLRQWT